MQKIFKNNFNNFLIVLLIFSMMAGWLFSGWPRVWDNPRIPSEIQEVKADTDTYYGTYDSANSDMTNSSYAETDNTQYAYGVKNRKAVIQNWSGTAGSGTISGVRIYCQHYAATPDGNDFTLVEYSLDNWVNTGATTGQQVMPDSEASFSVDITADRSPWNWTDIGNLEVRATAKANGKENFGNDYIDVLYIQVDYTIHNITTGTGGTQTTNMDVDSSDNYVGGYFTFVRDAGSANVTQIVISETGTVNANSNLSNVDIYYETAESCSYDADEALFGTAASFDASENATISGTMAVGTSQICVYVVLDVGSGASADETVLIEITNPSSEVTASVGTVSPGTAVVINGATTLQASSNSAPSITSISLNGGNNINLNEGTFKWATSTIAITDSEGCDTIFSVAAKLYRTATSTNGTTCSQNDLSCYIGVGSSTAANTCVATTTGNQCEAGVGDTSVEYDCGFKIWYIAHPTNDGASWASSIWSVSATTTDGAATVTATNTDQTVEIVAQNALDVTGTIDHTSVSAGNNTGGTNQTTVVTTTGNTAIDVTIEGTTMTGAGTIDEWQQKYDTDSVTYASLSYYLTSTTTPQLEIDNVKPTSTTSPSTDNVYWGLNVPGGTPNGSYSGTNTFGAASD